nr:MAG TPA: hypothetical protein [Caudoviricetes sp.]
MILHVQRQLNIINDRIQSNLSFFRVVHDTGK